MARFFRSFAVAAGITCGSALLPSLHEWLPVPGEASAQAAGPGSPAVSAKQVGDAVQAFYDQTKSVEAHFEQTYFNRLYDRYDRSSGQVRFQKPGRMRWDYDKPSGKVLVSDGKQLSVFEPGEGGEPGQLFEQSLTESQLPQALSFLTGSGKLEDDFAFRLLDAARQGFKGYVLELRPRQESPHYDRILFYVDADPARTGLVHRVLIIDHEGNRNRFDFSKLHFNRALDAKAFRFTPPAGTRRVQP